MEQSIIEKLRKKLRTSHLIEDGADIRAFYETISVGFYDHLSAAKHIVKQLSLSGWSLEQIDDASVLDIVTVMLHGSAESQIKLNDTEQTICKAIDELWAEDREWPNTDEIAERAGLAPQTTKQNLAPMSRHGILEKGPSDHGFKVRT